RWIHEAVKTLNGNVEDREAFLAALRKVEIADSPRGPVKLDPQGNPIQNVYFRKIERNKDGELQNTVIVTIPAVSQFWKYGPEEFLKQPVYSRDFPACKACCSPTRRSTSGRRPRPSARGRATGPTRSVPDRSSTTRCRRK